MADAAEKVVPCAVLTAQSAVPGEVKNSTGVQMTSLDTSKTTSPTSQEARECSIDDIKKVDIIENMHRQSAQDGKKDETIPSPPPKILEQRVENGPKPLTQKSSPKKRSAPKPKNKTNKPQPKSPTRHSPYKAHTDDKPCHPNGSMKHQKKKANLHNLHCIIPTFKVLGENQDPLEVILKAMYLESDSKAIPRITKDELLVHERLKGTLLAAADGRSRLDLIQAAASIGVPFETIVDESCNWNIVHAAVSSGSVDMLKEVLKHLTKAKSSKLINEYSALLGTTKWSPLLTAVKNGFFQAVPLLLEYGADPHLPVNLVSPDVIDRKTGLVINKKEGHVFPFLFAIKNCPVDSVQLLFEAMTSNNINCALASDNPPSKVTDGSISKVLAITDSQGRHAVHYLSERPMNAEGSSFEIFKYLLSLDSSLATHVDNRGNTPLHECCKRGKDDVALNFITMLASCGVVLAEEALKMNNDDMCPLVVATASGMVGSVRAILNECESQFDANTCEAIVKSLEKNSIVAAVNLAVLLVTPMDDYERGAFNAFVGLTNEPDQAQLVRIVKRLGAYYCMNFIAEFTISDMTTDHPAKMRRDQPKNRSRGGHFLTLLKDRLLKDGRHEDWTYIRVVTELVHKRMRGRPMKRVAPHDILRSLSYNANR